MKMWQSVWAMLGGRNAGSAASAEERKSEKGFTLIELVVVLAIIGALTALIVPRVLAAMNQAYVSTATNTARELQTAISVFQEGNAGSLPSDWGASQSWQTIDYQKLYGDVGQTIALPADSSQADFEMTTVTNSKVWSGIDGNYYTDGNGNYLLVLTARDHDGTEIVITNPNSTWNSSSYNFGKSGIYTYDPVTGVTSPIN